MIGNRPSKCSLAQAPCALLVPLLAPVWCAAQTCQPYYADMGATQFSFDDEPYFAVFNDGTGDALYKSAYLSNPVIRWQNGRWTPLTLAGLPTNALHQGWRVLDAGNGPALHVYAHDLGTGGYGLYRWTGTQWAIAPYCISCTGFDFSAPQVSMLLGGSMQTFGLGQLHQSAPFLILRWDATSWTTVGATNDCCIYADSMIPYDDGTGLALYVLGTFTSINGVPAAGMAKWDGQAWSAPSPDRVLGSTAHVAADLGDGPAIYTNSAVFIGGPPGRIGLNKWDGHRWTNLGAPSSGGVQSMTVFDDGRGPALYIGGSFLDFAGIPAHNIVRYDGEQFEALGAGVTGTPWFLGAFRDQRGPALYLGDYLTAAGGGTLQQPGVLWVGCPNCYANCDNSTQSPALNVLDFICFLNRFAARDPYANCTVDATIDVNDFVCFMSKFAAGCP